VSHEPDLATAAAELLAQRSSEPRAKAVDRQQGIALVAHAIGESARRRRFRGFGLAAAGISAAAAVFVVAGWLGGQRLHSRPAEAAKVCAGPECSAGPALAATGTIAGRPFEPGQSIVAGRGRSTLIEFAPGTQIALDEATELEYRQGDSLRRFGLLRGAVHLHVAKLASGQRFMIETADTEVEVRGTAFDVATTGSEGCASPRTRVDVTQGVVEVRFHGKTFFVHAGQHWPERCEVDAEPSLAPSKISSLPLAAARPRGASLSHGAPSTAPEAHVETAPATRESELSLQNDMYSEAVSARRAGRSSEAIAAYERLLARFPNGPLAESASVGKLRLLAKVDTARARNEARAYLSRYPRGMARAEAEALLGTP
jgi:ferric-dicitrate binding protein FerR (iron transport regulator)